jgi:hypothetical protein
MSGVGERQPDWVDGTIGGDQVAQTAGWARIVLLAALVLAVGGFFALRSAPALGAGHALPPPPAPPYNLAQPVIGGTLTEGGRVFGHPGTWGGQQPIAYTYEWQRCATDDPSTCVAIDPASGGVGQVYTLGASDVGAFMRIIAIATNSSRLVRSPSELYGPVLSRYLAAETRSVFPPSVSGNFVIGQTLEASEGVWQANSDLSFTYQWGRCVSGQCQDIAGAVTPYYLPTILDDGASIFVTVNALDGNSAAGKLSTPAIALTHGQAPECVPGAITYGGVKPKIDRYPTPLQSGSTVQVGNTIAVTSAGSWSFCNDGSSPVWLYRAYRSGSVFASGTVSTPTELRYTTTSTDANSTFSIDLQPCTGGGSTCYGQYIRSNVLTVADPGTTTPQCSDGADNDGDGKTDYPADPGCSSASDPDESDDPPTASDVTIADYQQGNYVAFQNKDARYYIGLRCSPMSDQAQGSWKVAGSAAGPGYVSKIVRLVGNQATVLEPGNPGNGVSDPNGPSGPSGIYALPEGVGLFTTHVAQDPGGAVGLAGTNYCLSDLPSLGSIPALAGVKSSSIQSGPSIVNGEGRLTTIVMLGDASATLMVVRYEIRVLPSVVYQWTTVMSACDNGACVQGRTYYVKEPKIVVDLSSAQNDYTRLSCWDTSLA